MAALGAFLKLFFELLLAAAEDLRKDAGGNEKAQQENCPGYSTQPKTMVPRMTAAVAPLLLRLWVFNAAIETRLATRNPITNCMILHLIRFHQDSDQWSGGKIFLIISCKLGLRSD